MKTKYELEEKAKERIKEIVMKMNGITEKELYHKYIHDIHFHTGFNLLVDLFLQAKFNE